MKVVVPAGTTVLVSEYDYDQGAIALDATSVYWVDQARYSILKMAK